MGETPDELKADIERTRQDLTADVVALTEKVSPGRVAGRRMQRVRAAVVRLRERVTGSRSRK